MRYHVNFHIKHKSVLDDNNDFLLDRIEHEYLLYFSNSVVKNGCFLIYNPRKYLILFKRDCAV